MKIINEGPYAGNVKELILIVRLGEYVIMGGELYIKFDVRCGEEVKK